MRARSFHHHRRSVRAALSLSFLALCVCGGGQDIVLVERTIVVDGAGAREATTDLGWSVRPLVLRAVVSDIELTSGGETHVSFLDPISAALVGTAHAHPGHAAGGEVLGELPGRFVIDFAADDGDRIGAATLVAARYDGANLTFARAGPDDIAEEGDPLLGHTFWIEGEATKDDVTVPFKVAVRQDEGRRVDGAVFSYEAREDDPGGVDLGLALHLVADADGRTLFDGIDFSALPADGLIPEAHEANARLKRALQSHVFWTLTPRGGNR